MRDPSLRPASSVTRAAWQRPALFAMTAALLALAGCGGGGSDTPADTRLTCNLPNFQADMLAAVNARRRAGATCGANGNFPAAPDLVWNAQLTQAAAAHSDDMVTNNFFSHTGSTGSTLGSRATAAGYSWSGLGENIAAGQSSVANVVDGWMKSDGHCANLMNAAFKDIGVACIAGGTGNTYRTYWTQDFGTPR